MSKRVKQVDMGLAKRLAQLAALSSMSCEIGIPESSNESAGEGFTLADIGAVHELGSSTVPARPWLAYGVQAARPDQLMRAAFEQVAEGKREAMQAMERAGLAAVASVQDTMGEQGPPLAQSTIDAKGSSAKLIDTGRLRASVSSIVIERAAGSRSEQEA